MKIRQIAIMALLTIAAASPASAIIPSQNFATDFQFSTTGGNVHTHLSNNGTATLHGVVNTPFDAEQAEADALKIVGVNRVVNLLNITNRTQATIASR